MFKTSLLIAGILTVSVIYGANLVKNGDFSIHELSPWKTPQSRNLHTVRGGKLQITGDPGNRYNAFISIVQDLPKLERGRSYLLSVKVLPQVKNTAGKWAKIAVRQADALNKTLTYSGKNVDFDDASPQTLYTIFTPNPQAEIFQLYIQTSALETDDLLTVDDVSLDFAPELKQDPRNLVRNGDFEYFQLTPWKSHFLGRGDNFFRLSGDTAYGRQCLLVSGDKTHRNNGFITMIQDIPILDPEKEYVLSARIRAGLKETKGKKVEVSLRQISASGGTIRYTGIKADLSDDSWKYQEKVFKPSRLAASFQLYVIVSGLEKGDLAAVDEIKLGEKGDDGAPFDPAAEVKVPVKRLRHEDIVAEIDAERNLLHKLVADGVVIQPGAKDSTVIAVDFQGKRILLDGRNSQSNGFRAAAEYDFRDGIFREVVTVTALSDFNDPVRIAVRHGLDRRPWEKQIGALRPLRVLEIGKPTIFSFRSSPDDLNPGILEQYQHTAYPLVILEGRNHYLLTGSLFLDDFVTLAPNHPAGYLPSVQRNPIRVKKGDVFRFETNWKLFRRSEVMLRDVWRFYQDHLRTSDPVIGRFLPPKYKERRHFYPGVFGSHTYFQKEREDRLPDGANVWFYSWHDNIHERYPVTGAWWSSGNAWTEKIQADRLKTYIQKLQTGRKFNLILYLRQLANLRERERGAFPDDWYKREPGGALHLYGGGYQTKLKPHVAREVGYDTIPWGHHNFGNPAYREFYLKEIFAAIRFYSPRAIGWDMGSDLDEFSVIAETYDRLRREGGKVKAVANESAGPTQAYADMVLLENGMLGGKSSYDFEIAKAYTTAVVCLERWNLFRLAFDAHTTGKKVWLSPAGLAENRHYFDALIARRPELKTQRNEAARLCQLRASLCDLALGASPGYLEEARPVPPPLLKFAGEVNGLFGANRSFSVTFPNRSSIEGRKIVSAWSDPKAFRLAVFNNDGAEHECAVLLNKACFSGENWTLENLLNHTAWAVDPEGEKAMRVDLSENKSHITLKFKLPAFTALLFSADK
ncbi:MAG: carbohydrate binding domain-containing protein [Lentisphaeria bacterium]|nr:carbohydrate binding domain-containing protein [Lentisphaeria bacterium]